MIRRIKVRCRSPLPQVVPAGDRLRRGAGAAERGQHQGGENCDDTNGHQQFDQGECA